MALMPVMPGTKPQNKRDEDEERRRKQIAESNKVEPMTVKEAVKTNQEINRTQPQSATQQLQFQQKPQEKWYKGSQPTSSEFLAQIYTISQQDPVKGQDLFSAYTTLQSDPASPLFNPYSTGSNPALKELAALGYDVDGGATTEWLNANSSLQQYLKLTSAGNIATPGKRATKEEKAAYYWYQLAQDEEKTQQAEKEWAALQEELAYWATRDDLNLSDEDILARIDWKNYKTLTGMDTDRVGGKPTSLNRAVGYSQDAISGVMWAARNGNDLNDPFNSVRAALGLGKQYEADEELRQKLTPGSDTYNPYTVCTLNDVARYFGVKAFDQEWLIANMAYRDSNDETAQKMYEQVYKAEQTTQAAEQELADLNKMIDRYIQSSSSPDADTILKLVQNSDQFPTLRKMDDTLKGGKLLMTTRGVDYKWSDIEKAIRDRCKTENVKPHGQEYFDSSIRLATGEATPEDLAQLAANETKKNNITAAGPTILETGTPDEQRVASVGSSPTQDADMARMADALDSPAVDGQGSYDYIYKEADKAAAISYLPAYTTKKEYEDAQSRRDTAQQNIDALKLGRYGQGNIDLYNRPKYYHEDGSVSTVYSMGFFDEDSGKEVLIPTIVNGQLVSEQEAIDHYYKTGEYLGKFDTVEDAEAYAELLHIQQQLIVQNDNRFPRREAEDPQISGSTGPSRVPEGATVVGTTGVSDSNNMYRPEQDDGMDDLIDRLLISETNDLNNATAEMEEKQSEYDNVMQILEELYGSYEAAAQVAGLTGAQENGGYKMLDMLNFYFEIGAEYKPPEYASYSVYDYSLQNGEDMASVTETAKKNRADYIEQIRKIDTCLKYLEEYGSQVGFSFNAEHFATNGKYNFFYNIQEERDRLEREIAAANYFLARNNEDFDKVVSEQRDKIRKVEAEQRDRWFKNYGDVSQLDREAAADLDEYEYTGRDSYMVTMLTDEERDTYLYLRGTKGADEAKKYYDYLTNQEHGAAVKRSAEILQAAYTKIADQYPVLSVGLSTLAAPTQAMGTVYSVIAQLSGQEINPNAAAFEASRYTSTVRGEVKNNITKACGGEGTVGSYLANLAFDAITSAADSYWNATIFGGLGQGLMEKAGDLSAVGELLSNMGFKATAFLNNTGAFALRAGSNLLSALPMGIQASSNAIWDAKMRGATNEQALAIGGMTAILETATEAFTIENMAEAYNLGNVGDTRKFFKKVFTQFLDEPLGEAANQALEELADDMILGPLGNKETRIRELEQYMTTEEAEAQYWREFRNEVLTAAATGFVSSQFTNVASFAQGKLSQKDNKNNTQAETKAPETTNKEEPTNKEEGPYVGQHAGAEEAPQAVDPDIDNKIDALETTLMTESEGDSEESVARGLQLFGIEDARNAAKSLVQKLGDGVNSALVSIANAAKAAGISSDSVMNAVAVAVQAAQDSQQAAALNTFLEDQSPESVESFVKEVTPEALQQSEEETYTGRHQPMTEEERAAAVAAREADVEARGNVAEPTEYEGRHAGAESRRRSDQYYGGRHTVQTEEGVQAAAENVARVDENGNVAEPTEDNSVQQAQEAEAKAQEAAENVARVDEKGNVSEPTEAENDKARMAKSITVLATASTADQAAQAATMGAVLVPKGKRDLLNMGMGSAAGQYLREKFGKRAVAQLRKALIVAQKNGMDINQVTGAIALAAISDDEIGPVLQPRLRALMKNAPTAEMIRNLVEAATKEAQTNPAFFKKIQTRIFNHLVAMTEVQHIGNGELNGVKPYEKALDNAKQEQRDAETALERAQETQEQMQENLGITYSDFAEDPNDKQKTADTNRAANDLKGQVKVVEEYGMRKTNADAAVQDAQNDLTQKRNELMGPIREQASATVKQAMAAEQQAAAQAAAAAQAQAVAEAEAAAQAQAEAEQAEAQAKAEAEQAAKDKADYDKAVKKMKPGIAFGAFVEANMENGRPVRLTGIAYSAGNETFYTTQDGKIVSSRDLRDSRELFGNISNDWDGEAWDKYSAKEAVPLGKNIPVKYGKTTKEVVGILSADPNGEVVQVLFSDGKTGDWTKATPINKNDSMIFDKAFSDHEGQLNEAWNSTKASATPAETAEDSINRALLEQEAGRRGLTGDEATRFVNDALGFYKDKKLGKIDTTKPLSESDGHLVIAELEGRFGVKIELADDLGPGINGLYDPKTNTIKLNKNLPAGQVMVEFALHELTHTLESTNAYSDYMDAVMGMLYETQEAEDRAVADRIEAYRKQGIELTPEQAAREIVADFTRTRLNDTETIRRMTDAGLAGKIRNALHNINQFLRNMFSRLSPEQKRVAEDLRRAERNFIRAIQEKASRTAAERTGDVEYSAGGDIYLTDEDLDPLDGEDLSDEDLDDMLIQSEIDVFLGESNEDFKSAVEAGNMEAANQDLAFALSQNVPDPSMTSNMPIQVRPDGVIAVHNIGLSSLEKAIRINGFAMPSIAMVPAGSSWTSFGEVSIFFGRSTVDPETNYDNEIFSGDAYTPMFFHGSDFSTMDEAMEALRTQPERDLSGWTSTDLMQNFSRVRDIDAGRALLYSYQNQTPEERQNAWSEVNRLAETIADRVMDEEGIGHPALVSQAVDRALFGLNEAMLDSEMSLENGVDIDELRNLVTETFNRALKPVVNRNFGANDALVNAVAEWFLTAKERFGSEFLEAKPFRPVDFSEVKAVLAPMPTDPDQSSVLKALLDQAGLDPSKLRFYNDNEERVAQFKNIPYETPGVAFSAGQGTMTTAELNQALVDAGVQTAEEIAAEMNSPYQRQFGRQTAQSSDALAAETKEYLYNNSAYTPDSNADQINRAADWVKSLATADDPSGYHAALDAVTDPDFDYRSADGQARMLTVMSMTAVRNDVDAQVRLADLYNKQGTDLGRMLQARKLFRLMTPEGRIATIQKQADNINEELKKSGSKTRVNLSEHVKRAAGAAKTEQEFKRVQNRVNSELAEQLPANWREKLQSWRMLSMLLNPRTHIRNVVGNAIFIPAVGLKNKIGAIAEIASGTEERTKTLGILSKETRDFAKQDALAIKDTLTGEAKYNDKTGVQREKKVFGDSFLQALSDFNSGALEAEDWFFLKGHYTRALGGWMQANGYTAEQMQTDTELLEKGRAYAIAEAQKATYRDFSQLASTLNEVSRKGGVAGFLVDAVLPFKRTPANILKRGLEYSPVGLVKSFTADAKHLKQYQQYQNGELEALPDTAISPNEWINNLSAGLSGTAILTIGALLASLGMLTVGLDDDDDEFEKLQGDQEYAIKLFGTDITATLDWAAPVCMPLFVGASICDQVMNGNDATDVQDLVNAFAGISEPVFNMSMLDGLNSLFQTSQYDETNMLTQIGAKIVANYGSSYVPTLLGAVARSIDPIRRKAFVKSGEGKGPVGTFRYAWEQVENKIPGLSQTNIPVRDAFGRVDESGFGERLLENFILPGYVSNTKNDAVVDGLKKLYEDTGDTSLIPKKPSQNINLNKETIALEDKQYDKLTEKRGQTAYNIIDGLMKTEFYQQVPDADKVEMIKDAWTYANQVANHSLFPEYQENAWVVNSQNNPVRAIIERAEDRIDSEYKAGWKNEAVQAALNGDPEALDVAIMKLAEIITASGKPTGEKSARSSVKTAVGNEYKAQYIRAYQDGDRPTMDEIETILFTTGLGFTEEDYAKWLLGVIE